MKVRNPLSGFALTILSSALLCIPVVVGMIFVPYMEFLLFYLGFAMFGVGVLAGRTSYLASMGFAGVYVGGFVGLYFSMMFLYWSSYLFSLALVFPLAGALGGALSGRLARGRLDRAVVSVTKGRRCPRCGSRVGPAARHCWDCHASLPTT